MRYYNYRLQTVFSKLHSLLLNLFSLLLPNDTLNIFNLYINQVFGLNKSFILKCQTAVFLLYYDEIFFLFTYLNVKRLLSFFLEFPWWTFEPPFSKIRGVKSTLKYTLTYAYTLFLYYDVELIQLLLKNIYCVPVGFVRIVSDVIGFSYYNLRVEKSEWPLLIKHQLFSLFCGRNNWIKSTTRTNSCF